MRPLEGQVLLKLLLPDLSDSVETLAHIACVSVQSYIDVETHIGPHFSELLDRTIGKLLRQQQKQLGSEDFERAGLTWLCLKAGQEILAERETAAAVLQTLQDTTASQPSLPTDHAQAVLKFFAQQGLMLTDELLLSAARLHNNYAGGLPRLMFEHSRLKDDKGEGLTGLSLEVEAAVLGLQSVQEWKETGWVPPQLPDVLRAACYASLDDSGVFENLLELDRLHVGMLFVSPPTRGNKDSLPEGGSDDAGQDEQQQAVVEAAELLADLVQTSVLRGNLDRASTLLALPVAQAIDAERLFSVMAALMLYMKNNRMPPTARATAERVFVSLCQVPSAKDLSSKQIADFLWENVAVRSDTIELCLLYLPHAIEMTPSEILYLLPVALTGCRLQVVKYLSVLSRGRCLDPAGVFRMLYTIVKESNATTFPFIMSDLLAFDMSQYLGAEEVMVLLAHSAMSQCVVEGVKYFSRMQAAKQLQAESVAEVIEFFVSHRHHCQHNVLCEAAKVLMSLPGSHTISHEWTQRILLAALHAGCMPSVKAVMRRWPRLNGWFKSLGTDHLVRALDASFSHSRCAPDELFKVVVSHPNAKNLTAAELEPVLNAVCSDRPLGMRDCGNDGCGPPTATAAQVLKRAPGKPLQKLLQLPGVKGVSADVLVKLITTLSYGQFVEQAEEAQNQGGEDAVWVFHLTAEHAAEAIPQLPDAMVLSMLDKLLAMQTADNSLTALQALSAAAPAVQTLHADAITIRLQAGLAAGSKDEHLQELIKLPGVKQWAPEHVAALVQAAAEKEALGVCVALLKLPQIPDNPVFKDFLKDMGEAPAPPAAAAAAAKEAAPAAQAATA